MDLLTITQKLLKNKSTKLFNIWNKDIAAVSDHATLRVSVIQWRLEVIKNSLTVFGIAIMITRKFHEIIEVLIKQGSIYF